MSRYPWQTGIAGNAMTDVVDEAERPTLTEAHACADCEHQIYDHRGGKCAVRRSNGVMCECKGFRFKNEGRPQ